MHIAILYNRVAAHDSAGDLDVLKQVVAVEQSLSHLGHTHVRIPCDLQIDRVRSQIRSTAPDIVFNLVESLGGTDELMPVATIMLESMRVPFTGASTLAMLKTTQKLEAKKQLLLFDLPTPAWMTMEDKTWNGLRDSQPSSSVAIIKAVAEHSSLGMNDHSVVNLDVFGIASDRVASIKNLVARKTSELGHPHFVEQFIDGREFNLSVLAQDLEPVVLPPAEIEFIDFPPDKPKIVGQDAKWNEDTSEYIHTPRRFNFPNHDRALLDELQSLARRCWQVFELKGYARVDFRVDADGQPWILEINANPCLSPDAGFVAAAKQAGLTFDAVLERILNDTNSSIPKS